MKKFVFTPEGQLVINTLNEKVENIMFLSDNVDYYNDFNDDERLLSDLQMYLEGDYIENEFEDIKKWCNEVEKEECDEVTGTVYVKITDAIKDGIIEIVAI